METNNVPTDQAVNQINNAPTVQGNAPTNSNRLFVDIFPTTELGVDVKLLLRTPRRLAIGGMIVGIIIRDDEDHFTFTEAKAELIVQYVNEKK